jgi:hypothetical protein
MYGYFAAWRDDGTSVSAARTDWESMTAGGRLRPAPGGDPDLGAQPHRTAGPLSSWMPLSKTRRKANYQRHLAKPGVTWFDVPKSGVTWFDVPVDVSDATETHLRGPTRPEVEKK